MVFDPSRTTGVPVTRINSIFGTDVGDATAGGTHTLQEFADQRRFIKGTVLDTTERDNLTGLTHRDLILMESNADGEPQLDMWYKPGASAGIWKTVAGGGSGSSSTGYMGPFNVVATGDGIVTTYNIPEGAQIQVGRLPMYKDIDYTQTSPTQVTFVEAPADGEEIATSTATGPLADTDAATLNSVASAVSATNNTIAKRGADGTVKANNHASLGSSGAAGTAIVADASGKVPAAALTASANEPSAGEKDALAGTSGTPSSSNKYVTNADSRLAPAGTSALGVLSGGVKIQSGIISGISGSSGGVLTFPQAFSATPTVILTPHFNGLTSLGTDARTVALVNSSGSNPTATAFQWGRQQTVTDIHWIAIGP